MTKRFRDNIFMRFLLYFFIGFLAIGLMLFLLRLTCGKYLDIVFGILESNGFNYLEILSIQVSVSFIVISVVTVFSEKSRVVYWQDIMRYMLVDPKVTNFNALSSYLFADLILTIALIVLDCKYVYICFFISIILIMFVSLKMLAVYFSGDKIKIRLAEEFRKDREGRKTNRECLENYRNHKRKLIQYTIQAINDNDIDEICDNAELLYKNDEDDVVYIIQRLMKEEKNYTVSRVAKTCNFIFAEKKNIDFYFEICRQLVTDREGVQSEHNGYVISIIKSMCEYTAEAPDADEKYLIKSITDFVKYSESTGFKTHCPELIKNCEEKLGHPIHFS